jgi:hypothetical protein
MTSVVTVNQSLPVGSWNVMKCSIDPEYLNTPFYTSAEFQKEPDASKWAPHPCKQVAGQ